MNYRGFGAATLEFLAAYQNTDAEYGFDEDWTNTEICEPAALLSIVFTSIFMTLIPSRLPRPQRQVPQQQSRLRALRQRQRLQQQHLQP